MEPDAPDTHRLRGRRGRPSFFRGLVVVFVAAGLVYLAWNYFPEDPLSRRFHDHLGEAEYSGGMEIISIEDFIPIGTPIEQACSRLTRAGFSCAKVPKLEAVRPGFDALYFGSKVPWYSYRFVFAASRYSVSLDVKDQKVGATFAKVQPIGP